jgi:hypothetical protein
VTGVQTCALPIYTRITSNTASITANTNNINSLTTSVNTNTTSITALDTRITSNTASITTNTSDILLKAPINSPTFTGTPTAPTPATSDNSTKVATTEYVKNSIVAANAGLSAIGSISATSNVKGATISGTTELILTPADATNGGVVVSGDHFTKEQASSVANVLRNGGAMFVPTGDVNRAYRRDMAPPLPPFVYQSLQDLTYQKSNNHTFVVLIQG